MNKGRSIGYSHIAITQRCSKAFHCNELTFINKGSIDVRIADNFILSAGQAFTYVAWPGEINDTVYDIMPVTTNVNGMLLIAICKNYNE